MIQERTKDLRVSKGGKLNERDQGRGQDHVTEITETGEIDKE